MRRSRLYEAADDGDKKAACFAEPRKSVIVLLVLPVRRRLAEHADKFTVLAPK